MRNFFEETPFKTQINILSNLFGGIFAAAIVIVLVIASSKPGRLIDPMKYNLRTISGQVDFASAVRSFNVTPTQSTLSVAFLSIFAIYCFALVIKSVHPSKFPRSVVALILDEDIRDQVSADLPTPEHQG